MSATIIEKRVELTVRRKGRKCRKWPLCFAAVEREVTANYDRKKIYRGTLARARRDRPWRVDGSEPRDGESPVWKFDVTTPVPTTPGVRNSIGKTNIEHFVSRTLKGVYPKRPVTTLPLRPPGLRDWIDNNRESNDGTSVSRPKHRPEGFADSTCYF